MWKLILFGMINMFISNKLFSFSIEFANRLATAVVAEIRYRITCLSKGWVSPRRIASYVTQKPSTEGGR